MSFAAFCAYSTYLFHMQPHLSSYLTLPSYSQYLHPNQWHINQQHHNWLPPQSQKNKREFTGAFIQSAQGVFLQPNGTHYIKLFFRGKQEQKKNNSCHQCGPKIRILHDKLVNNIHKISLLYYSNIFPNVYHLLIIGFLVVPKIGYISRINI